MGYVRDHRRMSLHKYLNSSSDISRGSVIGALLIFALSEIYPARLNTDLLISFTGERLILRLTAHSDSAVSLSGLSVSSHSAGLFQERLQGTGFHLRYYARV